MIFGSKPIASALVAMVTLALAISASVVPVEQHLVTRDGLEVQPDLGAEAVGKHATPVNLAATGASPQAVMKLVGEDLHTSVPASDPLFENSMLIAPVGEGSPGSGTPSAEEGNKAHCYLGHPTADITSIRYTMSFRLDRDESGDTTFAGADSTRGVVVKATSGLYSSSNPEKGSCAKALARHGEACANRPYIVPKWLLPQASSPNTPNAGGKPGSEQQQLLSAGPYLQKRTEQASNHAFSKRDTFTSDPQPGSKPDVFKSGSRSETLESDGSVCIDTVKHDKQIFKVVPTEAKKHIQAGPTTDLHFVLVRSKEREGGLDQIISDANGRVLDITHLTLSEKLAFWHAEYFCPQCKPGHQVHSVYYENVEIEVEGIDEHAPKVHCEGQAHSTKVHKKKSRYQDGNQPAIEYKGTVFSIDRVVLGSFDKDGEGVIAGSADAKEHPISGKVPVGGTQGEPAPRIEEPTKPLAVNKRDVAVPADGPIF